MLSPQVNWSVFEGFRRPVVNRSWSGVNAWTAAIEARLGPTRDDVLGRRMVSDKTLERLGGDPSSRDWSLFRPLRRYREEDWSDWLAQLIEDCKSGAFGHALFGRVEGRTSPLDYSAPEVRRELLYEGYRADLIIDWRDGTYTHVEVKVGDTNLGKTLNTARKMESHFERNLRRRSDAILLLPTQCEAWDSECVRTEGMRDRIHRFTWLDVARALRSTLCTGGEAISWQVWAHAFCGAIEQELLGLLFRPTAEEWSRALPPSGLETALLLLGDC